jgi:hypothetical protein
MKWTPDTMDRRLIRGYAARAEKLRPHQIVIEVGERVNYATCTTSFNTLLLTDDPDFDDTDLHDTRRFTEVKTIPLTADGRAQVDFYIYEREGDDQGDLLTNVQAHVASDPVTGKPVLWKLTGTLTPAQIIRPDVAAAQAVHKIGVDG